MRNIDLIHTVTAAAGGHWPVVLAGLGIDVPASPRAQVACPACGGKDRFRFDDYGRGSHFCNQCGAGDGLDLVQKVKRCDATTAAREVAQVLGINPAAPASVQALLRLDEQRAAREDAHQQQATEETRQQRERFTHRYQKMALSTIPGESAYLISKGLTGFAYPLLPDGALLLALVDVSGIVTAAQTITPQGEKRLLVDSGKRGAFHAVNAGSDSTLPENAQTVILAEGLATALSVHCMQPEALTVCAVDAGNLLPVALALRERYPQAVVILAADNDSEPGKPNTGKLAAEKAALVVAGRVALPPGDARADWNDIHHQQGLNAATALFDASLYQPEGDIMKPRLKTVEGTFTPRQNERDPLTPFIESGAQGVFRVEPQLNKQTSQIWHKKTWLCDPVEIVGEGVDADSDDTFISLRWTRHGTRETVNKVIRPGLIGDPQGWAFLKNNGLNVVTSAHHRTYLADWLLQQARRGQHFIASACAGWTGSAYIMPDGNVIGEPETPVMFTGGSAARSAYGVKGTAESWRDNVARLAHRNPFQMLAAATAFAAPLIGIVDADGFGIHLYAGSTAGKTTAEDFASSLYGLPKPQRLSWYGTALGIANEAQAHNHGLLALDEIEQASHPRHVFTSAYTLFNGKGKLQGDPNGGNREMKSWETAVISTGEKSMETFLAGAGIKVKAGQLVRLLNIPVTRPTELHGYVNGKDHADAMRAGWLEHHGAAGREWIKWLATHKDTAKAAYAEALARWNTVIPADYGEQVHRVKDRIAILEAALLLSLNITGWEAQACRDAIQHVFNVWIAEFGTGNKEHEQIIEQATAFLMANSISRFIPVDFDELSQLNVHNLAGYKDKGTQQAGEPITFYILPGPFKDEVTRGFDVNQAARALYEAGMLKKPTSGKSWQNRTPRIRHMNNRQLRAYAVLLVDDSGPE
ncbi:DUF927 domain-containing protein [Lelliottia wanjuensis]|uniref:DUF927 domain-containing protein n=1 Tax=Lelliottia wanjuensis TaxID=3050585 RepID=UPI003907FB93